LLADDLVACGKADESGETFNGHRRVVAYIGSDGFLHGHKLVGFCCVIHHVTVEFSFRLFQPSCEDVFTTEAQRGGAAIKTRNISRKGAKAAKKLNFRTWRSWRPFDFAQDRLGASKSRFLESHGPPGNLRKARKFLSIAIRSSQSSENFLNKNLFTLRPPRLRGAISEPCFTSKPEDLI